MYPASFDYHAPAALDEALALLDSLGENVQTKSVGLVLNQSQGPAPGTYYGYGEYYGSQPPAASA